MGDPGLEKRVFDFLWGKREEGRRRKAGEGQVGSQGPGLRNSDR